MAVMCRQKGKKIVLRKCVASIQGKKLFSYKVNLRTNKILLRVLKLSSVQYRAVIRATEKFQRVENPITSIITTKTIRKIPILCRQVQ